VLSSVYTDGLTESADVVGMDVLAERRVQLVRSHSHQNILQENNDAAVEIIDTDVRSSLANSSDFAGIGTKAYPVAETIVLRIP
jgi:hypothetical protein